MALLLWASVAYVPFAYYAVRLAHVTGNGGNMALLSQVMTPVSSWLADDKDDASFLWLDDENQSAPKERRRRRAEKQLSKRFALKTSENLKGVEKKRTLQKHPFGQPFLRTTPFPLLGKPPDEIVKRLTSYLVGNPRTIKVAQKYRALSTKVVSERK